MKVLINLENTEEFSEVEVELSDTIETFKYLVEACFSIPFDKIGIVNYHTNQLMNYSNNTHLSKTFLKDNEGMVVIRKLANNINKANVDDVMNMINSARGNTSNANTNTNNNYSMSNSNFNNNTNTNSNNMNLGSIFDNTMKMIENNRYSSIRFQAQTEAKNIYNQCMVDPGQLSILFNSDVEIAEAVASESLSQVEEIIFNRMKTIIDKKEKEKREYEQLLKEDSNDPEAQKKIEAYIYKQKIQENKQLAMEYFPESFYSFHHMLYIPLEINQFKVIALVDTGAQMTIMSVDIAHKCGLYNLIDTDYKGQAIGVGTSKIIGVIHCAQIKIKDTFIMAKITVIENVSVGFILGLDNMRSHRCTIELSSNSLIFKDAGLSITFLSDGEAKKLKEIHQEENEELLKKQSTDNTNI